MATNVIRDNLKKWRTQIQLVLVLCVAAVMAFFLWRSAPWRQQDAQAHLLQVVNLEQPLDGPYRPKLGVCRELPLQTDCAVELELLLQAAEADGCLIQPETGYLSRQELEERVALRREELIGQGMDAEEANLLLESELYYPGTSEHELGLAVDLKALEDEQACLGWLQEHSWEYGFVLRYGEGKEDWTGRSYLPWHYRYVGREAALQMQQLGLCLEEYYLWFYSDAVIVLNEE